MPGQHKVSIKSVDAVGPSTALGLSRTGASHLVCMETTTQPQDHPRFRPDHVRARLSARGHPPDLV